MSFDSCHLATGNEDSSIDIWDLLPNSTTDGGNDRPVNGKSPFYRSFVKDPQGFATIASTVPNVLQQAYFSNFSKISLKKQLDFFPKSHNFTGLKKSKTDISAIFVDCR